MNWPKVIDQVATWRRFKAIPGEYLTNLIGLLGRTPPAALADRRTGLIANDRYHGVNQSGVNVGYTRLGIDDIHIVFLPPTARRVVPAASTGSAAASTFIRFGQLDRKLMRW